MLAPRGDLMAQATLYYQVHVLIALALFAPGCLPDWCTRSAPIAYLFRPIVVPQPRGGGQARIDRFRAASSWVVVPATITVVPFRNVAIVAHVDHGKTTLVDHVAAVRKALRERGELQERVMDTGDREGHHHPGQEHRRTAITRMEPSP